MEERYNQPISAGQPKGIAGSTRPKASGNAMGNAAAVGLDNGRMPNMNSSGAMPYMTNNIPNMMNQPNTNSMLMTPKPITGIMPEMNHANMNIGMKQDMLKPNIDMIPEVAVKPNMGIMPDMMPAKPNMGAIPDMMPAKPNMGAMPDMMPAKPNMGAMPDMMPAKPNMGVMPDMMPSKPNMGVMPDMMPAKPNMGAMPDMMPAKPNMGAMPDMMPAKPNMGAMPYMANPNMGHMVNSGGMNQMGVQPNAENDMAGCGFKNGELPPCAPLAAGFIPFQSKNPPKYGHDEALTRGTLFPGLDLPFKDIVNKTNPYAGTPLGEMMALGFVIKELNLYLDTHPNDKDALDMLKQLNKLMQEGMEKYVKLYGPQTIMDIMSGDKYTWIDNPWPWEYTEKGAADNHV